MKKENKYIGHSSLGRCKIKTLTSFVVYNQVQSFLILREKMDLYVDWYVFADPAVENCYYLSFEWDMYLNFVYFVITTTESLFFSTSHRWMAEKAAGKR